MVIHHFNRLIKNKWVWGVFAIAISVFFAFDFLFTGGGDDKSSSGEAGKLAGKDVSLAHFRALVEDARGFGRARDNRSSNAEINKTAWKTAAALAVAKAAHLEATDNDVREAIRRDPSFGGANGFNLKQYQTLLRENGMTPEMFEAFLKRRLTLNKLQQVVLGSASWVSPAELEGAINDVTDKFTVRIADFVDKEFDKVKLDDKKLEEYYNANTNSLALPDLVTVKYAKVMADTPERLAQFKISEDEMRDRYDATLSRFESTGTNGVTTTKSFEEVKGIVEKELQVIASVEALNTNLLFRIYPATETTAANDKTDRLQKIADEEKVKVEVSKPFSIEGRSFVKGFMTRASAVAPGCRGFAAAVAELDPESADLRYGVVAGTNCVYVIERNSFTKAHIPSFADSKEHIRADALADAQAKDFKARVEKKRALAAAELAKGKPFDAKLIGASVVTTSIVFSVSSLQRDSFADSMYIAGPTMKLQKGQLSDLITTAMKRRGIVVYVENREPGDAAQAQIVRSQLRDDLSRGAAMTLPSAWLDWNLGRMGYETTPVSSVEVRNEVEDIEE